MARLRLILFKNPVSAILALSLMVSACDTVLVGGGRARTSSTDPQVPVRTAEITGVATGDTDSPCTGVFTLKSMLSGVETVVDADSRFDFVIPASGSFYSDAACSAAITFLTISQGLSSAQFYYRSTVAGSVDLETAQNDDHAAASFSLTMNPGVEDSIQLSGFSANTSVCAITSLTATVLDANGNVKTDYTGQITFTSSDGAAVLPADYTFIAGDLGVKSFNVTLNTLAAQSVTATDTTTASVNGSDSTTVISGAVASFTITGISDPVVAGSAETMTITAKDACGATVTNYTGTVSFTSSDAQALLPADYTFLLADNGVKTRSVTLKTAGEHTVTATDAVSSSVNGSQTAITVTPSSATTLSVTGVSDPIGQCAQVSPVVRALDAYGNTDTNYTGTVTASSSDGAATLPVDYTFLAGDNGLHTFTNAVVFNTVGEQTLSFTDTVTGTITGTQSAISVTSGTADHFDVSGVSDPHVAGTLTSATVTVRDACNGIVTGYTGTVTFSSNDPGSETLPSDYTFLASDNGSHTFTNGIRLVTAQDTSLTVTDTVSAGVNGSQTAITVTPGTATQLTLNGHTDPVVAGVASSFTVTAKDAYGNTDPNYLGTVTFTSSDVSATLPADYTFLGGDNGVKAFASGSTLETVGEHFVRATDTVTGTITGQQTAITVQPAGASLFQVTGISDPLTAGSNQSVTVTAKDAFGNLVTNYTGTITASSSDGAATLPADYTFLAGDLGVKTFTNAVVLKTAGVQNVTFTDTVTPAINGSQNNIDVNPAAASVIQITSINDPTTAGDNESPVVTIQDAYGNTKTDYVGEITFSSSDGAATLPTDYTFLAGDNGSKTFTNGVVLKTAGTHSVTVTDTSVGTLTGSQTNIDVNVGALSQLIVSGVTDPIVAGVASNITIKAADSVGNAITSYTGTVTLSSSDGVAELASDYTFVGGDAGVKTISNGAIFWTAGEQTLVATDTVDAMINGTQADITVTAASAPSITTISPNSGSEVGGTAITITGTGFHPGVDVEFLTFTQCAAINRVSATQITCTTPAGTAGTATVRVQNPDAQNDTDTFTYLGPPPTITTVAPSSGPIAGGTTITITGTLFEANVDVEVDGTDCTNINVTPPNTITCDTPAHAAGTVNVTVRNILPSTPSETVTQTNAFSYYDSTKGKIYSPLGIIDNPTIYTNIVINDSVIDPTTGNTYVFGAADNGAGGRAAYAAEFNRNGVLGWEVISFNDGLPGTVQTAWQAAEFNPNVNMINVVGQYCDAVVTPGNNCVTGLPGGEYNVMLCEINPATGAFNGAGFGGAPILGCHLVNPTAGALGNDYAGGLAIDAAGDIFISGTADVLQTYGLGTIFTEQIAAALPGPRGVGRVALYGGGAMVFTDVNPAGGTERVADFKVKPNTKTVALVTDSAGLIPPMIYQQMPAGNPDAAIGGGAGFAAPAYTVGMPTLSKIVVDAANDVTAVGYVNNGASGIDGYFIKLDDLVMPVPAFGQPVHPGELTTDFVSTSNPTYTWNDNNDYCSDIIEDAVNGLFLASCYHTSDVGGKQDSYALRVNSVTGTFDATFIGEHSSFAGASEDATDVGFSYVGYGVHLSPLDTTKCIQLMNKLDGNMSFVKYNY